MGGGLMQLVAYGAQDVYLTGNPGKSHTDVTQTLQLNLLNKLSTARLISAAVLHALSAEMVILPTAHISKSHFLRSTNLWAVPPTLPLVTTRSMLVG